MTRLSSLFLFQLNVRVYPVERISIKAGLNKKLCNGKILKNEKGELI